MPIKDKLVNRRAFLKGSAATGAAGVAGGLTPSLAKAEGVPAKWDKEVDVVIVGTGHAGLAAAITAADAGAKVVILEKMKKELRGRQQQGLGQYVVDAHGPPAGAPVHRRAQLRPHRQGVHPGACRAR